MENRRSQVAKELPTKSSLTRERSNEIAQTIAESYVFQNFRVTDGGEYRRRLGQAAQETDISVDELHQFLLDKLPKAFGKMFGWSECSITGKTS